MKRFRRRFAAALAVTALAGGQAAIRANDGEPPLSGEPWTRHTIDRGGKGDRGAKGADGVKLADVDRDGRVDIVTGWEESGIVRVAFQPERERIRDPWTACTIGAARAVEDAHPIDLDADGRIDIVAASEGSTRTLTVFWGPKDSSRARDTDAWPAGEVLPASADRMAWMFCASSDVDRDGRLDLVAGGKGAGAAIGWFRAPADARRLEAWTWNELRTAGWVMTIAPVDVDADGFEDLVVTDRKGARRGAVWLRHPGKRRTEDAWREFPIGAIGREVMFADVGDFDADGRVDVAFAVKPKSLEIAFQRGKGAARWEVESAAIPPNAGTAKSLAVGDLDGDGTADLVYTCEGAKGRIGAGWIARGARRHRDLGGARGTKFDYVVLRDLDGDGDLDAITCEEREQLGVVWYENRRRGSRE